MSEADHQLYLLHALTPLHVGGDEGVGGIDLPTMREVHTDYPIVPGSSVKGVLREAAELSHGPDSAEVRGAFGPPQAESGDFRGGLIFTDANLLALPVRSLYGTFAWVTCEPALSRLARDLEVAGLAEPMPDFSAIDRESGLVPAGEDGAALSALVVQTPASRVFLEELALRAVPSAEVASLAAKLAGWLWPDENERARSFFVRRLLIVHEDVFSFYTRLGLELRSRVKIDRDTGTAADSGPWAEEHMPAETVLVGLIAGRRTKMKSKRGMGEGGRRPAGGGTDEGTAWSPAQSLGVLRGIVDKTPLIRFGGHSTIGLGRARFRLVEPVGSCGEVKR
jgi:CRISPR-associated protein Cmr4